MAYKIYQKLQSGMANQGLLDAADVDVMEDGQRVTLAEKLSGLSEDVAGMAEDVSDAVAVADGIKTAQGQEVGDVAETDIAEGVLIWHGGKLYRVLSLIAAGDRWQDMDVEETTVSEEINAMRGVSTEGVYLTITPASAIPVEGVKARIYNEASQTYLPEVTFTPASPHHLLGQIAYGDVYTIIMPSIDGYTQPADQTFKAGQMLRQRTVEYLPSASNIENLTISVSMSDGATVPSANATIKTYNSQGAVIDTILVDLTGGTSQSVQIPFGTRYTIDLPTISGYYLPRRSRARTASASEKVEVVSYIAYNQDFYWVTNTGAYVSMDTDISGMTDDIIGIATNSSTLIVDNVNYNFIWLKSAWTGGTANVVFCSKVATNYGAHDEYNGESNTQAVIDYVADCVAQGETVTTGLSTIRDKVTTINGVDFHHFCPAYQQAMLLRPRVTYTNLKNLILTFFGGTSIISGTSTVTETDNGWMRVILNNGWIGEDTKTSSLKGTFIECIQLV